MIIISSGININIIITLYVTTNKHLWRHDNIRLYTKQMYVLSVDEVTN